MMEEHDFSDDKKIKEIMKCTFGIDKEIEQGFHIFSYSPDNPLFKPTFVPPPPESLLTEYFKELRANSKYSDVTILVNGRPHKLHKAVLARCPFFAQLFDDGRFKEAKAAEIPFDYKCSNDLFSALLEYLYEGKIKPRKDFLSESDFTEQTIALFHLADYLNDEEMKKGVKGVLWDAISLDNFSHIAILSIEAKDADLHKLCNWFFYVHKEKIASLDLSSLSPVDLLKHYLLGKAFDWSRLKKRPQPNLKRP